MKRRRRSFAFLAVAVLALAFPSVAQKPEKAWRVGFLAARRRPVSLESDFYGEVPRGLRELGYVEGKSLVIEWRFADGNYERLAELAVELVKLKVDIIVADGMNSTLAAQKATKTIPIVFAGATEPVEHGLVKSLAHPGGNTTGLALVAGDTCPKQLEMLLTMVPGVSLIAVLWNPDNPSAHSNLKGVRAAAEMFHVKILAIAVRTPKEIESAFAEAGAHRAAALVVSPDMFISQQLPRIAGLAATNQLPGMSGLREYAEAGGLMSYGASRRYNYHRAATYVDKIIKGANPGELPVEQPMKLELVINRKTAKALGLTIPPELLLLADKVIE